MSKPPNVFFLIFMNAILHSISASLAGVWIAELVAGSGEMTSLAWFEVVLAVIAIAVGLTTASIIAIRFIPTLPSSERGRAKVAFVAGYTPFALALALIAGSTLGAPAAERAHMEWAHREMTAEVELHRSAVAVIQNRTPLLDECYATGSAMGIQEAKSGAYSLEGGSIGRVATSLANVASGCAIARDVIYGKRSYLSRQFARSEALLLEVRRTIDGDKSRKQKIIAVRKLAGEFGSVMRDIKDALGTQTLAAASEGLRKDWLAAGLPAAAAKALSENFDGIADALIEDLGDVEALKTKPVPSIPDLNNIEYLAWYPSATAAALVVGLMIELIPISVIWLAMGMAERGNSPRAQRATKEDSQLRFEARPKRPYKRRAP